MRHALRRRLVLAFVALAAVIALAVFGLAGDRSATNGRPAPALPRERLLGAPATISSLLADAHGRAALVVFWASWCGPCANEAPALERFATSPQGRGRIVGVDWSDPVLSAARGFIRRYAWTFPNLRDREGSVGVAYHLTGLPTTFVIDARGRIRATLRGPQSQSSLERALARIERS
jgi:cytochrome c biogenesis protein CcmG/thiol:disulfide interchange protein DsbE